MLVSEAFYNKLMINSVLTLVVGIITSLLDGSLVVMLILGLLLPSLLFFIFNIFPTSFADKAGNTFLTHKISLMYKTLYFVLEACA